MNTVDFKITNEITKTYSKSSVLNIRKEYSTFEIPESISYTKKLKKIKATINYSLYISNNSSMAGSVSFESVNDAKKVLEFNKNRSDVTGVELLLRINGEWYKEDGVTLRYKKTR